MSIYGTRGLENVKGHMLSFDASSVHRMTAVELIDFVCRRHRDQRTCTLCADLLLHLHAPPDAGHLDHDDDFRSFAQRLVHNVAYKSQSVVLVGDAGSGKTNLCRHLCEHLASSGLHSSESIRSSFELLRLFAEGPSDYGHACGRSRCLQCWTLFFDHGRYQNAFRVDAFLLQPQRVARYCSLAPQYRVLDDRAPLHGFLRGGALKEMQDIIQCIRLLALGRHNDATVAALLHMRAVTFERLLKYKSAALPTEHILCPLPKHLVDKRATALAKLLFSAAFQTVVEYINGQWAPRSSHGPHMKSIHLFDSCGFVSERQAHRCELEELVENYVAERGRHQFVETKIMRKANRIAEDVLFEPCDICPSPSVVDIFEAQDVGLVCLLESLHKKANNDYTQVAQRLARLEHPSLLISRATSDRFLVKHHVAHVTYYTSNFMSSNVYLTSSDVYNAIPRVNYTFLKLPHVAGSSLVCSLVRKKLREISKKIYFTTTNHVICWYADGKRPLDEQRNSIMAQAQRYRVVDACRQCIIYKYKMKLDDYYNKMRVARVAECDFADDFFVRHSHVFLTETYMKYLQCAWATNVISACVYKYMCTTRSFIRLNAELLRLRKENDRIKRELVAQTRQMRRFNQMLSS